MRTVDQIGENLQSSTAEPIAYLKAVFAIKDSTGNSLHVPLWFDHKVAPWEAQILAEARFRETISKFGTPRGRLESVSCVYWQPNR